MAKNKVHTENRTITQRANLPWQFRRGKREDLERAGVVYGGIVSNNHLLAICTLPHGWQLVRTEDSQWKDLLDDKGNRRASVYICTDVFRRNAYIELVSPFTIREGYQDGETVVWHAYEDGRSVFASSAYPYSEDDATSYYQAEAAAKAEAETWLDEHCPDWRDPNAYWN